MLQVEARTGSFEGLHGSVREHMAKKAQGEKFTQELSGLNGEELIVVLEKVLGPIKRVASKDTDDNRQGFTLTTEQSQKLAQIVGGEQVREIHQQFKGLTLQQTLELLETMAASNAFVQ